MKPTTCVFLGVLFALLIISYVAANDAIQDEKKTNGENQVANERKHDGAYGGGWGGPGGGGGYGGWGGYGGGGWGGPGGGGGWGGGGGGWGGGGGGWGRHCRWGCCGGGGGGWGGYGGGGCRCCYTAQEALAYMQNEVRP
ncbi:hypothetical protein BUALT_Bualt12G0033500 [Buddleja alternifolia]|uniref:Uncharacterized protein n=1 Tax=Buddleja alternifolia TaxID=168488 RepID=A0AAV6WVK4_9LAMI|nr:hypothetical protein BUALT_Bualt12G0033500 [Buddleja alternifolia]